jgi:hypothetical protein
MAPRRTKRDPYAPARLQQCSHFFQNSFRFRKMLECVQRDDDICSGVDLLGKLALKGKPCFLGLIPGIIQETSLNLHTNYMLGTPLRDLQCIDTDSRTKLYDSLAENSFSEFTS